MRDINRINPAAGPEHFKTYAIVAPVATHYRRASCQEVECGAWAGGFRSTVDVATELGIAQARYIEGHSCRRYSRTQAGTVVTYEFPAGQRCFRQHQLPLEREPLFIVRGGDHRGDPRREGSVSRTADEWVDDFATHQQRIAAAIERG
jgi:hypothetical protein